MLGWCCYGIFFHLHENVAGRIPDLVAEIAVALDSAHIEINVTAGGGKRVESVAQGVRAKCRDTVRKFLAGFLFNFFGILRAHQAGGALAHQAVQVDTVNEVDGIQDIALGFRHFLPFTITDQAMDIDFSERNFTGEFQGHHDHACYPEENNVEGGYQHFSRMENFQFFCVFRPAERGKSPQR